MFVVFDDPVQVLSALTFCWVSAWLLVWDCLVGELVSSSLCNTVGCDL